ncbi:universal stress protein A-like protein [Musa acuminata AAA Group]|uniref:universal stress protein A-like protein n=1 Tax=Musa acuminata AAA Group TaxID=214697 RepID=UPI0031D1508A
MAEGGAEGKAKRVMVAIDESESSHYALEWVLSNLRSSLSSSPLVVFTVQPYPEISYLNAASFGAPPMELIQTVQQHQKELALSLLEKAKEICIQHGVVAETISEVGDPKEAICEAVEKLKIDLLIVGSHGKGAIQRVFLGSISNYCVHNAKCPVLVVKKSV